MDQILNLNVLPKDLQQEVKDYFDFLLHKYKLLEKKPQKDIFLNSVKKHKFSLPDNYQFNRNIANER